MRVTWNVYERASGYVHRSGPRIPGYRTLLGRWSLCGHLCRNILVAMEFSPWSSYKPRIVRDTLHLSPSDLNQWLLTRQVIHWEKTFFVRVMVSPMCVDRSYWFFLASKSISRASTCETRLRTLRPEWGPHIIWAATAFAPLDVKILACMHTKRMHHHNLFCAHFVSEFMF